MPCRQPYSHQDRIGNPRSAHNGLRRFVEVAYIVNMTLSSAGVMRGPSPAPATRTELVDAVVEEMTAWHARTRLGAIRRWHQGSLSLIHLSVLNILEAAGPMSMSAVAEELDVSIASATGIVDRMEKRCLVERRHGTEDRRVVTVHPTEQGLAVIREIESEGRANIIRLIAELTDDELAAFLTGIRAMHAAGIRVFGEHHPRSTEAAVAGR